MKGTLSPCFPEVNFELGKRTALGRAAMNSNVPIADLHGGEARALGR
jgi:hypothetical protein